MTSNALIMFTALYYCTSNYLKKITLSLHHSLDPLVRPPEPVGHSVHYEVGHHLQDHCHQGGCYVVGYLLTSHWQKLQTSHPGNNA